MIVINNDKAIESAKTKLRAWRDAEFTSNDIAIQNALADGDDVAKAEAIKYRDYLRDVTDECNEKTVEELKTFLQEKGVL